MMQTARNGKIFAADLIANRTRMSLPYGLAHQHGLIWRNKVCVGEILTHACAVAGFLGSISHHAVA